MLGEVSATIEENGDIVYSNGYTSRRKGSTPTPAEVLNSKLNDIARNTDDLQRIRQLVSARADLCSHNGDPWLHTPLHQAAWHGRNSVAELLVGLGAPLWMKGHGGRPVDVARLNQHCVVANMLDRAMRDANNANAGGN